MSKVLSYRALAVVFLALPVAALAQVTGTVTLSAGSNLSLDTGKTVTTGGDISWNGTSITVVGSATDVDITSTALGSSFSGSTGFSTITAEGSSLISEFASSGVAALSTSAITPAVNDILAVKTNGGNYAAVLVTATSSASVGLQFETFTSGSSTGTGTSPSGGPTINTIQNNYSNIPPGFPSYAIAPASLFVIYGSGLSGSTPSSLQNSATGLPTTLNGTTISVTVNGKTTTPPMYYVSATQIDAILPSNTPAGNGTLTVTYNGQSSSPANIVVAASAFGIDTLSGTGSGAIVATTGSGSVIEPTSSASPGQTIAIWGSGLGADPASTDDTTYPLPQHNLNNAQVYVGGVQASVSYAGRSQFPGVDQINITVPSVSGCGIAVVVVANGIASNFGSLPVNQGGGVCSDPVFGTTGSQIEQVGSQGTVNYGNLFLLQETLPTVAADALKPHALTTSYYAEADFESETGIEYVSGSQFYSLGSCFVTQVSSNSSISGNITVNGLDAGTPLTLTGGGLSVQLPVTSIGSTVLTGEYYANLTTPFVGGTAYTFTGPGGKNVGPFSATITFPTPLNWTNESSDTTVTESQGVSVTWTGGATGTYVIIAGSSTATGTNGLTISAGFSCLAPANAGQFSVPSYVLIALPKGTGSLGVYNFTVTGTFTASGLNVGTIGAGVYSAQNVTYQ